MTALIHDGADFSAVWVDDLGLGDDAVPYALTEVGAVLASEHHTLEDVEAAVLVGVSRLTVRTWGQTGTVPAVEVDGVWLFDAIDIVAQLARRQARREPRVPAGPLLRQIELRGGDYALGVRIGSAEKKALERAREDGTLTVWAADWLTTQLLGLTPWEVWGEEYLTA